MQKETLWNIFRDPPVLEGERLLLRKLYLSDAEDMYAYAANPRTSTYLTWYPHESLDFTREYLQYIASRYAVGDFYDWAVVEKRSGRMIGTCGFTRIRCEDDVAEIGYVLNPTTWGRGYAAEAGELVLRLGFDRLGLRRIEARFIEGNERSLAVMNKLGMRLEGYLRNDMCVKGIQRTIGICSILREEFLLD
jgi:ribosomal-protein-alanine N-acetyltransferase